MGSVLNTGFYLPFATRNSDRIRSESALIQDLLCYDHVLVLTDHMAAVGMLAAVMGANALDTALESGTIRFVNDRNMLGWTGRVASGGVAPIVPIRVQPTIEKPQAFTETSLEVLARESGKGYGIDEVTLRDLAQRAQKTAIDFTDPLTPQDHSTLTPKGGGVIAAALERVQTYKEVAPHLSDFPLKLGDLIRFERDLRDAKRSPLQSKTLRLLKSGLTSGWDVANQVIPMTRKQLGLLNLYLSDHFLAIHAAAAPESTLHTEKVVEEILTARLTAIRRAAGQEFDEVLRMAQVEMPSVAGGEEFPYRELLTIRNSAAAHEFRRIVGIRDTNPDQHLIQAYYRGLKTSFGARTGLRTARFLTTTLAGLLPFAGTLLSAADTFLVERLLGRRDARYFIDEQLTRLRPK